MIVKELRIGNWVQVGVKCVKIIGVRHNAVIGKSDHEVFEGQVVNDIIYITNTDGIDFEIISSVLPIPLTEEILIKAGFENRGGNMYQHNENINILIELYKVHEIGVGNYNYVNINRVDSIEIKYVHQLQNLYFALTGNELNIQL